MVAVALFRGCSQDALQPRLAFVRSAELESGDAGVNIDVEPEIRVGWHQPSCPIERFGRRLPIAREQPVEAE
jgi:hypothetical protein